MANKMIIAAVAAATGLVIGGCISVDNETNVYNGNDALNFATNEMACVKNITTMTTTNGIVRQELTAGGGVVTSINVNSSKEVQPNTSIPVSVVPGQ